MEKPVGPKARPSLKNCKPEPGPGPIVKVQARARPARGKKIEARAREKSGPTPLIEFLSWKNTKCTFTPKYTFLKIFCN